jgi:hypothetical protein
VTFEVEDFEEKFYAEYQHQPIMVDDYDSDEEFTINVQFYWYGSPRRDFTVKVYSLDGNDVEDPYGETNMLHTDGQSPSEFDYISETYPDGREVDSMSEADSSDSESNSRFSDTGCTDTNGEHMDSYGDGCDWY